MFRKVLLSTSFLVFFVGCGGGSSTSNIITSNTVSVERGAVLEAIVKDASGQVATNNSGTNTYTFSNTITYPITVSGGFVDVDGDGIKNNSDFDLDLTLKASSGENVTLLSTLVYNSDETILNENIKLLAQEFSINEDELLNLPSSKKELALLTNIIYKNLKLNSSINLENIMDLLKENKLDLKSEYEKTNLDDYSNLTSKEFLKQNELKTLQDIENIKILRQTLPNYSGDDLTSTTIINEASAYISPQCYTKTQDENFVVSNPCYSCHINSIEPNYIDDFDLQESYAFSENSYKNPFTNSFKDRTTLVDAINDDEILNYINEDNYKDE